VAVNPPSTVVTVTVAVPGATGATTPVALTVATDVLLEDHVTDLSVASAGETVATSVVDPPATVRFNAERSSDTPATATVPPSESSHAEASATANMMTTA